MESKSLLKFISKSKVSSVLNKDTTSYGRKHLFDGSAETCWNSEQGLPQSVMVEFTPAVKLSKIHIQFQGGFAGKDTRLVDMVRGVEICPLHPNDNNQIQVFDVPESEQDVERSRIKIQFLSSTDFYGRIVIYALDFIGHTGANSSSSPDAATGSGSDGTETQTASAHIVIT
ncbi:Nuclear receptor 2C2-associated protein [Coemansia sp. RSA 485]|nr:Nuclear receptor 2C2-associated protein [Coemansia sp. RSA 485]